MILNVVHKLRDRLGELTDSWKTFSTEAAASFLSLMVA